MRRHFSPCLFLVLLFACTEAAADKCPNIMLVLDASGSMLQDPFGKYPGDPGFKGQSKWELLQQVVTDCVKQFGDRVPFGLMIYSGGGTDDVTCAADCKVQLPVATDSAGAILKALRDTKPQMDAQTPTNGAIHVARADPGLANPKLANYIILVTDGDPNCGSDKRYADPNTHVIDTDIAQYPGTVLGELDRAFKQVPSIRTLVIGFDGDPNGVNTQNLENMGYYGGDRRMGCGSGNNHCYSTAGVNSLDFKRIFTAIITKLISEIGMFCDNSCYALGCAPGEICTTDESFPGPHCVPDPCMGASCGGGTFCRLGQCVKACTDGCPAGTECRDGACAANPCSGKSCVDPQLCDPKNGACVESPCPMCIGKGYCDVATGKCETDQCKIISCPSGTHCVNHGDCQGDGDGTGGCHCGVASSGRGSGNGSGGPSPFEALPVLLALGLIFVGRGRRRC